MSEQTTAGFPRMLKVEKMIRSWWIKLPYNHSRQLALQICVGAPNYSVITVNKQHRGSILNPGTSVFR